MNSAPSCPRLVRWLAVALLFVSSAIVHGAEAPEGKTFGGWKAGTAKTEITPKRPMWMAGYGSRTHPANGTLHELYVRALALQDRSGKKSVLISSDLVGVPRAVSEDNLRQLGKRFGLARARIMLTTSHTHSGPVLEQALYDAYPLDDAQRALIDAYTKELEAAVVRTVGKALGRLSPATLAAGQGTTDFAVNRRTNREPDVPAIRAKGALRGPTDHAVPVLAVRGTDGKLLAVAFGYACHNTTLDLYQWSGDYAGFAASNLEESHPGATALFHMGCGADQNPLPRRTAELCRKYGRMMSDAVEATLGGPLEPLFPTLAAEYQIVPLQLAPPPSRESLAKLAAGKESYIQRWAKRLLAERNAGRAFEQTYPYPIQAWKLGNKQLWIALGGEVVVDYALRFKDRYGADAWITSYANDVMAYIPSRRVLREGGYEGNTSMMVYGMPSDRWADDVEDRIATGVDRVVAKLK